MPSLNVVRRIDIEGRTTGVDEAKAKVEALGKAHDDLVVASDKVEKAQLSAARALERVQRTYDAQYRAEQRAISATRTLDTARAQGLISHQRHAELLEMIEGRNRTLVASNDNVASSYGRITLAMQAASPLLARFSAGGAIGMMGAGGLAGALAGGAAATGGIAAIAAAGDAWTVYSNRLLAAGESTNTVRERLDDLFAVATRSRSSMQPVVDLYSSIDRATKDLGVSQSAVLKVTETITKGFAVNGTAASQAAGAILQLGQAFQSGTLRGDELNSVMEGAPAIARLVAKEFQVGTGEIRKLAEAGKLTADRVFQAIANGSKEIEAEFGRTNKTMAEAAAESGQAMLLLGARIDDVVGISRNAVAMFEGVTAAILRMAASVGSFTDQVNRNKIANLGGKIADLELPASSGQGIAYEESIRNFARAKEMREELRSYREQYDSLTRGVVDRQLPPLPEIKLNSDGIVSTEKAMRSAAQEVDKYDERLKKLTLEGLKPAERAQREAADAFAAGEKRIAELERSGGATAAQLRRMREQNEEIRRRTIENAESKRGGRRAPRDDDPQAYERAAKRIEDQNRRLEQQAATFGMTAGEAARYRVEMELVAAINRTGKDATAAQREEIARLGDQAAAAAERLEMLRRVDALRNMGADAVKGFVSDLRRGVDEAEAFANALDRVADRLLDMMIDQAFKDLFSGASNSGGGGGLFASLAKLMGGGFAGGGFTGHGGVYEPAGVVHRGEYVFDAASTRMIGVGTLEAMRKGLKGYAAGGPVGPAPAPFAIGGPSVSIKVVDNAGVKVGAGQPVRQPDGSFSIDVVVDQLEQHIAGRYMRGQGSLAQASGGSPHLRG